MLETIESYVRALNNLFFSELTIYLLLTIGVVFTIWTRFGQFVALTHGVAIIRGKYDRKDDPGAINHFQALSAALSATVGLGNIAGVAVAVAVGGPGAVFWMWVIGFVGMALKMTEVTQSMLHRRTTDPDNPHGGPMFVVRDEFERLGFLWLGKIIGGIFCVTLILAAITGGNMFQAFNVAEVTRQYIEVPKPAIGIVLTVVVGLVIIGGIKRIGAVTGRLVPLMCLMYLMAGFVVLFLNVEKIPEMLWLIVQEGVGLRESSPSGAFVGGSFGLALAWGIKRALFSSEAGQGSSPIAHSAAKTDQPVREGVVAGLEPFIDTLVVCTVTALVILSTGAWNRAGEAQFSSLDELQLVEIETDDTASKSWQLTTPHLPTKTDEAKKTQQVPLSASGWAPGDKVFILVKGERDPDTASDIHQIFGDVEEDREGNFTVAWTPFSSNVSPTPHSTDIYVNYVGAGLTAHAFDRAVPGLGKWLIILASWLFAVSTMISWSYYGEQGVYFLGGQHADRLVLPYRLMYCGFVFISTLPFIKTEEELDLWTTLGLGAMLCVNIPIMALFGFRAMRAYHSYMRDLKAGKFVTHEPQSITDVVEGK